MTTWGKMNPKKQYQVSHYYTFSASFNKKGRKKRKEKKKHKI